jgi:hypothetical protein
LRILSFRRFSELDKPIPLVRRLLKRVSRFTARRNIVSETSDDQTLSKELRFARFPEKIQNTRDTSARRKSIDGFHPPVIS